MHISYFFSISLWGFFFCYRSNENKGKAKKIKRKYFLQALRNKESENTYKYIPLFQFWKCTLGNIRRKIKFAYKTIFFSVSHFSLFNASLLFVYDMSIFLFLIFPIMWNWCGGEKKRHASQKKDRKLFYSKQTAITAHSVMNECITSNSILVRQWDSFFQWENEFSIP